MHPRPQTLADWYAAAQMQHATYAKNKATLVNLFICNNTRLKWEQALGGCRGQKHGGNRCRDDDAMDVDTAWMAPLSEDKKRHLQAENRCFFCKNQGHISQNCQKKKSCQQGGGVTPTRMNPPQARTMETKATADNTASSVAMNSTNMLQMIKGMNDNKRMQLLDSLILELQDF
jgi:hypothetical protein